MRDFADAAQRLLADAPRLLQEWLPAGRIKGAEFEVGNLRGEPGDSLKINVRTGRWQDFATGEKGGDLISLFAAIKGVKQAEAHDLLFPGAAPHHKAAGPAPHRKPPPKPRFKPPLGPAVGARSAPAAPEGAQAPPDASKPAYEALAAPFGTPPPDMASPKWGQPTATWAYKTPDGRVCFYIARYDPPGQRKQFYPWRWLGGRWQLGAIPGDRPLYGLQELAAKPEAAVLVVEGEKACEAARQLAGDRYVPVTWAGGAAALTKTNWDPLIGRKLVIWPDADEPGIKAAKSIADNLRPYCPEIAVVDIAGQPDKWDAADALAEGWDWLKFQAWIEPRLVITVAQADPDPPAAADTRQIWKDLDLALDANGRPINNVFNVVRILERHGPMKGLAHHDQFWKRTFHREGHEWTDEDTIELMTSLQGGLEMHRIYDTPVHQGVIKYAKANQKNEPRDWLESLKWDGQERVPFFFQVCLGARRDAYTEAASKNFWVGMVARVFRPGCRSDHMVVLEGRQGIGKTEVLRIIGGKFYADMHYAVTDKDFYNAMQGKFLIEIAELDAFSKADITRIKQVITCTTDRYRLPYARTAQDFPRSCVFVGTTNEADYLKDPTGGRRFWPITCTGIDTDFVRDCRDQLFAEAVARLRRGEAWHEMPKDLVEAEQESRRRIDEWESLVSDFCTDRLLPVTVPEIATSCLKVEVAKLDVATQRRITTILRRLGWQPDKGGKGKRQWTQKREVQAS